LLLIAAGELFLNNERQETTRKNFIENPPENCHSVDLEWWKAQRKRLLSRLGTVGGSITSPRKASASRKNGAKGGRPRKKNLVQACLAGKNGKEAGA